MPRHVAQAKITVHTSSCLPDPKNLKSRTAFLRSLYALKDSIFDTVGAHRWVVCKTQGRISLFNTKFHEKAKKSETHCGWGNVRRLHRRGGLELADSSKIKCAQVKQTLLNFPLLVSRNLGSSLEKCSSFPHSLVFNGCIAFSFDHLILFK